MTSVGRKLEMLISEIQYMGGLERILADQLMANGVTIPVRCKDCNHYTERKNNAYNGHFCDRIIEFVQPNDFCSYGERKDNGSC